MSHTAVTCQTLSDWRHVLPAAESAVPVQLAEAGEHTPSVELSQVGLADSNHWLHEWHIQPPPY